MDMSFTRGYGCGAVPHVPDVRDHDIARIPQVAALLAGGIPDEKSHASLVRHVYSQGTLPACVAYSTAGMQSLYQQMERESIVYDAASVYWENGGDGTRGVPTINVLRYAKDKGMPELSGSRRNRIESYAFTRDIDAICAALASDPPLLCVFAMLLPTDFWRGDCSSMERTANYHQVLAVGYSVPKQRLYFLNSWGASYGNAGFGSVPFSFLRADNNQNGFFYAYTTRDVMDGQQLPPPVRVITGLLDASGAPTRVITPIQMFSIQGKGFGTARGTVFLKTSVATYPCTPIGWWTDTLIELWTPPFANAGTGATLTVSAPMQPDLNLPGIEMKLSPTPPKPAPKILGYARLVTVGTTAIQEGLPLEIRFDGFDLTRPCRVWCGAKELPIVARYDPNRLIVMAPQVAATTLTPLMIEMLDDGSKLFGPMITIGNRI